MPHVTFEALDIEENLDCLVWYANPKNSKHSPLPFDSLTIELFPFLKGKIHENKNDEEIYLLLEREVKPILEQKKNSEEISHYQQLWDAINDDVMRDLEKRLHISWKKHTKITGRVGLLPVAPRDIQALCFDINYGISPEEFIATTIHELCHFLYFEKWKELYPHDSKEVFSPPHIAWYLSEAMIDPILHNDIFHRYTSGDLKSYPIFYQIKIQDQSIIQILRQYVQDYPMEEAIQKGYELFQKYQDFIIP